MDKADMLRNRCITVLTALNQGKVLHSEAEAEFWSIYLECNEDGDLLEIWASFSIQL